MVSNVRKNADPRRDNESQSDLPRSRARAPSAGIRRFDHPHCIRRSYQSRSLLQLIDPAPVDPGINSLFDKWSGPTPRDEESHGPGKQPPVQRYIALKLKLRNLEPSKKEVLIVKLPAEGRLYDDQGHEYQVSMASLMGSVKGWGPAVPPNPGEPPGIGCVAFRNPPTAQPDRCVLSLDDRSAAENGLLILMTFHRTNHSDVRNSSVSSTSALWLGTVGERNSPTSRSASVASIWTAATCNALIFPAPTSTTHNSKAPTYRANFQEVLRPVPYSLKRTLRTPILQGDFCRLPASLRLPAQGRKSFGARGSTEAEMERAQFSRARFEKANLTSARCLEAMFAEANFEEAFLMEADLTGANLSNAQLRDYRASLRGADLSNADATDPGGPRRRIAPT